IPARGRAALPWPRAGGRSDQEDNLRSRTGEGARVRPGAARSRPSGPARDTWRTLGGGGCGATEAGTARDAVCPATSPDGEHSTRSMATEDGHDAANSARRPVQLAIALTGG